MKEKLNRVHWNVQIKVSNLLRMWIKQFYKQDFSNNNQLMDALYNFFDSLKQNLKDNHNSDHNQRIQLLIKTLEKTLETQQKELEKNNKKIELKEKEKQKILANIGCQPKTTRFKLNDYSAQVIAEQITLMDFKIFSKIEPRECLGQAWKRKDCKEKAPNIIAMIEQFNKISKLVQVLILIAPDIRKRVKTMRKCIKIALHLKECRNISSLCAFNSALISTPIHRLKDAWNGIPQNDIRKFEEIKELFGMADGYKKLRRFQREVHAPAILHFGLWLQEIVGIDEGGNGNRLNGMLPYQKTLKLCAVIDNVLMYQQVECFCFVLILFLFFIRARINIMTQLFAQGYTLLFYFVLFCFRVTLIG